jgi:hypothetical protein
MESKVVPFERMIRQPCSYRYLNWIAQALQRVQGAWVRLREIRRSTRGASAQTAWNLALA